MRGAVNIGGGRGVAVGGGGGQGQFTNYEGSGDNSYSFSCLLVPSAPYTLMHAGLRSYRGAIASVVLPRAECGLLTGNCLRYTVYGLLPTVYCLLSAACCLLPTT